MSSVKIPKMPKENIKILIEQFKVQIDGWKGQVARHRKAIEGFEKAIAEQQDLLEALEREYHADKSIFDAGLDAVAENKQTKLVLTYIGEGYHGDYNPEDPEDEPLLRVDLYDRSDIIPDEFDMDPYETQCTTISARISMRDAQKIAKKALSLYKNGKGLAIEHALDKAEEAVAA